MFSWKCLFTPTLFEDLTSQYNKETSYGLALISSSRIELDGCSYYPWSEAHQRNIDLEQMVRESLRWGEPYILLDNRDTYVWTVPISLNNIAIGGIFSASHGKERLEERETRVGGAARLLMDMACRENICNSSLMKINSEKSRNSTQHAEIIHTFKKNPHQHPREIYLRDEFELLTAIKKRDRQKAREIINSILVGVYNLGSELTRDGVARYCNMSPAYFSRVFKEKTGHTFSDQLNRFRIEQACFLLADQSLNQIINRFKGSTNSRF